MCARDAFLLVLAAAASPDPTPIPVTHTGRAIVCVISRCARSATRCLRTVDGLVS